MLVGRKFPPPERRVVAGLCRVPRATVPEAAIDEDGGAESRKDKVRLAEDALTPPPACDAMPTKHFNQGEFGIFISMPANPGHHLRAFGFGENVGHEDESPLRGGTQDFHQATNLPQAHPARRAQLVPIPLSVEVRRVAVFLHAFRKLVEILLRAEAHEMWQAHPGMFKLGKVSLGELLVRRILVFPFLATSGSSLTRPIVRIRSPCPFLIKPAYYESHPSRPRQRTNPDFHQTRSPSLGNLRR